MGAQDWGSKAPKVQGVTPAATVSIDPSLAPMFAWAPNEDETVNATDPGKPGEELLLMFGPTPNTTSRTITFGANFRSAGALATGTTANRYFNVKFQSNGLIWNEISRTAALA